MKPAERTKDTGFTRSRKVRSAIGERGTAENVAIGGRGAAG